MSDAALIVRLGEEIGKVEEFIALLEQEQDLLTRADTEALLPLVERKNAMAAALADYSKAREELLQQRQMPPGRTGMEAWLAKQTGAEIHLRQWHKLLDLAEKARSLNETNGKLIALHLQQNQQAFSALMSAANRAMIYGPDGQQQTGTASRILGTA